MPTIPREMIVYWVVLCQDKSLVNIDNISNTDLLARNIECKYLFDDNSAKAISYKHERPIYVLPIMLACEHHFPR